MTLRTTRPCTRVKVLHAQKIRRARSLCSGLAMLVGMLSPLHAYEPTEDLNFDDALFAVTPVGDARMRIDVHASEDLRSEARPSILLPFFGRVGALAVIQERFAAKITVRANAALGDLSSAPNMNLDEGYLEARLDLPRGRALLRLGRQAFELWDGYSLSNEAFSANPRLLDAFLVQANVNTFDLIGLVTLLDSLPRLADHATSQPRSQGDYLVLCAGRWQLKDMLSLQARLSGHYANKITQTDDPATEHDERETLLIGTLGADIFIKPNRYVLGIASLDMQTGNRRALEHFAHNERLRLEFSGPWFAQPTLVFGYDYASGDALGLDGRSGAFDAPLAAVHTRFGGADFLRPSNAQDVYVAARLRQSLSSLSVSVHRLSLAQERDAWISGDGTTLIAAKPKNSKVLGYEFDVDASLSLSDAVSAEIFYALFIPEEMVSQELGPRAAQRLLLGLNVMF